MSDLQIDNVGQMRWLLLVLACGGLVVYGYAMKRRAMAAFASLNLFGVLAPDASRGRPYLKAACLLTAMTLLVLALMGPRWGLYWEDVQSRQLDLMICLDVSRSMLAEDAGMSRLDRAKDDIKRLLDELHGGMVGLVAFAGRANLVCPLTDDYDFYRLTLDDVGIQSAPLGGTNIGQAIEAAVKGFGESRLQERAILLLTDGEDHGEAAIRAAKDAHEAGVRVYTIGIGDSDRGGLIPIDEEGQRTYLQYDGQQVWSKLDPAKLRAIAAAGGGEYHPSGQVTAKQRTLEWVYAERLAPLEKQAQEQKQVQRRYARFQWPAGLALVLLAFEPFIAERARRSPVTRER